MRSLSLFDRIHIQVDIIYTHYLPPVDVDYLLIQQVSFQKEESFGSVRHRPLPHAGDGSDASVNRSTAVNGRSRLPFLVFTINAATRDRSSPGASATSRTRPPAAPDVSYTGAPSTSVNASVVIA
jgi:hypothetical protein